MPTLLFWNTWSFSRARSAALTNTALNVVSAFLRSSSYRFLKSIIISTAPIRSQEGDCRAREMLMQPPNADTAERSVIKNLNFVNEIRSWSALAAVVPASAFWSSCSKCRSGKRSSSNISIDSGSSKRVSHRASTFSSADQDTEQILPFAVHPSVLDCFERSCRHQTQ